MINYGKVLRDIRESKGLSLKTASEGIMSSAFLSKIERDISIPNLDLLLQLLERLRTSYSEFSYLLTHEINSNQYKFSQEFSKASVNDDTFRLHELAEKEAKLYAQTTDIRHRNNELTALIMKAHISGEKVSDDLKRELKTFLLNVDDWGIYELTLYTNTMATFDHSEVMMLTKTAIDNVQEFWGFDNIKEILIAIITNTLYIILETSAQTKVTSIINTASSLVTDLPMSYASLTFNAMKAVIDYRNGKESAVDDMRATLQVAHYFGEHKRAQDMEAVWTKYTAVEL